MEMDIEEPPVPVVPDTISADPCVPADLDLQPLNELGVGVMDQDVLERNVAAQVRTPRVVD